MGINFRPQVPQETQEYPHAWKINESGPSCGFYEQYLGPTDNRQYRPIKNGREEGFIFEPRLLVMH